VHRYSLAAQILAVLSRRASGFQLASGGPVSFPDRLVALLRQRQSAPTDLVPTQSPANSGPPDDSSPINISNLAELVGVLRTGRDLSRARLVGAMLAGAKLKGVNLSGALLTKADLPSADLSLANLREADLSGANLIAANLSEAYLSRANLRHAYLFGANLYKAHLVSANLTGAELIRANLTGAELRGANLTAADLRGARLGNADLPGADLTSVAWNEQTVWPDVLVDRVRKNSRRGRSQGEFVFTGDGGERPPVVPV
jgi:hypothetical protein